LSHPNDVIGDRGRDTKAAVSQVIAFFFKRGAARHMSGEQLPILFAQDGVGGGDQRVVLGSAIPKRAEHGGRSRDIRPHEFREEPRTFNFDVCPCRDYPAHNRRCRRPVLNISNAERRPRLGERTPQGLARGPGCCDSLRSRALYIFARLHGPKVRGGVKIVMLAPKTRSTYLTVAQDADNVPTLMGVVQQVD
jgi:hypothetical protein